MSEELDLDDREDAIEHVQQKRLLEQLSNKEREEALAALLRNESVRDYLWEIIGWCGVFADPMNSNFGNVAYGLGKAAIGKKLLVEINRADPKAWRDMQLKAARAAQDEDRQKSSPKLRKPANP